MKRFLLFAVMYVCVSIGAWAQDDLGYSISCSDGVATVIINESGSFGSVYKDQAYLLSNNVSGWSSSTTLKVIGSPNTDDYDAMATYAFQNFTRVDLTGVTTNESPKVNSNANIKQIILPPGMSATDVQGLKNDYDYSIVNSAPLEVIVKNSSSSWATDPYITAATDIIAKDANGNELDTTTEPILSLITQGKTVNGENNKPYEDLVINTAETPDILSKINEHLLTYRIGKLTIVGEMSPLSVLSDLKVQSLDLSGVDNSDITGLILPTIKDTSEGVKLPKGITYISSGDIVIESPSTASITDIDNVVIALKAVGLAPVSIEFPGGSSVSSSGVLTIDASEANDIQKICEIISFAGIPVNSITFPDGSALSSGTLSIANSTTDKDKQKELLKACKELGCIPTTVNFPNNASTCVNGTLTPESNDKIADLCEVLSYGDVIIETINFVGANAASYHNGVITFTDASDEANLQTYKEILENANLPVNGVVFSTGTKLIAGKLTVESSDDNVTDLTAKVGALKGNGFTINSAQLPGNIYWNKDGSVASPNGTDNDALKTKLETAGLTPVNLPASEVEVYGSHVTVVNGVTIITTTSMNELPGFTQEEIDKIKVATNLKLVGPFSNGDDITNNLKGWCKPTNLDLSEAILESSFQIPGDWRSTIEALTLPTSPDYTVIPTGFFTDATKLKSISIPANIEEVAKGAFLNSKSLEAIDFAEDGNLRIIGESAFQQTGIKGQLVIPNSVRRIEASAFKQCTEITSLVINKDSELEYIGQYAFVMDQGPDDIKLKNVYIYAEKEIECDGYAWDFYMTDGQTDMATVTTRLHYPPSMYYWYVGDWKADVNGGRIEGHDDLLALRNSVDNGIAENGVKVTPKGQIGWQKFVSSGIPVTAEFDWRTYSDIVDIKVPEDDPDPKKKVADVYIVCNYIEDPNGTDHQAVLKQMVPGDIIPAGTGIVIHHYVTDSESGGLLIFPHVTPKEAVELGPDAFKPYRFVSKDDKRGEAGKSLWNKDEYEFAKSMNYVGIETRNYKPTGETLPAEYADGYPNYLEAIHCMGVERAIYNAENGNYTDYNTLLMGRYSGQKVTYRNFFFGHGQKLNASMNAGKIEKGANWEAVAENADRTWGFFRCISKMYAINSKAFLHFPATIYTKAHGGSMNATEGDGVTVQAKDMGMFLIGYGTDEVVDYGIATGINNMNSKTTVSDDSYYTLQGLKVNTPTKRGIYIFNGKKVVIR